MSRVFERLGAGEMALGVWLKGGPSWVPTIAHAGFDFDPEVWKALDSIVQKAAQRNIAIAANMGYDYTTHQRMSERVQRMSEHGVRLVLMQGADNMLQNFATPLLNEIRTATK